MRAIDPTKEAVDGGRSPEPLSDAQAKALDDLKRASRELGVTGSSLIMDVLGLGMILLHAGAKRQKTSKRELLDLGDQFRDCLDKLAVIFGYAMKGG